VSFLVDYDEMGWFLPSQMGCNGVGTAQGMMEWMDERSLQEGK
jgi:hypothetical protein